MTCSVQLRGQASLDIFVTACVTIESDRVESGHCDPNRPCKYNFDPGLPTTMFANKLLTTSPKGTNEIGPLV